MATLCCYADLDQAKQEIKIGLIYASRYGATADNAAWIAQGVNRTVVLLDIEKTNVASVVNAYDYFIVGSGIWRETVHDAIRSMIADHTQTFNEKLVASFVVCGTQPDSNENNARIASYFSGIHAPLRQPPPLSQALGGRLRVETLSEQDHKLMTRFYQNILKTKLVDWDRTDPAAARAFGQHLAINNTV